jgi:hypothetical protein
VEGLGSGPFVALADAGLGAAVAADGRLFISTPDGPRSSGLVVGPALGSLGPRILIAASPAPPEAEDAILVLPRGERDLKLGDRLGVPGLVRALSARERGDKARLVAALEEPGGETFLLALDLRRTAP